jgi:hypothetical protein
MLSVTADATALIPAEVRTCTSKPRSWKPSISSPPPKTTVAAGRPEPSTPPVASQLSGGSPLLALLPTSWIALSPPYAPPPPGLLLLGRAHARRRAARRPCCHHHVLRRCRTRHRWPPPGLRPSLPCLPAVAAAVALSVASEAATPRSNLCRWPCLRVCRFCALRLPLRTPETAAALPRISFHRLPSSPRSISLAGLFGVA